MSNDTQKADQIAFHFYTKLFYVVNQARATAEPKSGFKVDKWFNLETPDSDLFTKEAREPYKNISTARPPPLEIQVVLAIPELANNQVLVYLTPEGSRIRIEPTPRFIVLESWTLSFTPRRADEDRSIDVALPTIYKHGIPLFRSLYSLLRVLPTWKLFKRLKRRSQQLSIQLRVRSSQDRGADTLNFDTPPSSSLSTPLATQVYNFSAVPHPLGSLTLSARYLEAPNFQLEELESVLSSRFISQDLGGSEGFVPTLTKNHQRDSSISSSGMRSLLSRSPPKTGITDESASIAERFILPVRTPSRAGTSATTTSATTAVRNIPQPPRQLASGDIAGQSPSGLAISRLRKESMGSSPSSSLSGRDTAPFATANPSLTSLSSSPSTGPLPIRRPSINPVHPFKSNTVSPAGASSPSLSIRQGAAGSPLTTAGSTHSRSSSITGRPIPSPIGVVGFGGPLSRPSPSSLDAVKRPGTSGSAGSNGSDRISSQAVGSSPEDGRVPVPPQRKRYSSSFGHRYAGSVGSTDAPGGSVSEKGTPAMAHVATSGLSVEMSARERKPSSPGVGASFMSTATDDDDISIFVQDIDSRKPLSGRHKEREKRDNERQAAHMKSRSEDASRPRLSHEREDSEVSTVKASRQRSDRTVASGSRTSTSPPPPSRFSTLTGPAAIPGSAFSSATMSTSPPALSLSPTRGPMLTNQSDVEERLRRMNETFLKSLESFGAGGNAAKRKEKEARDQRMKEKEKERERSSTVTQQQSQLRPSGGGEPSSSSSAMARNEEGEDDSEDAADRADSTRYAGRGLSIRPFPSRENSRIATQIDDRPYRTSSSSDSAHLGYNGPRVGRGHESTSSLGHSEIGASQGSEEVIGQMELFEERSRRGRYHRFLGNF